MEGGPTRWRKVSDTVAGFLRADGKVAPIYAKEAAPLPSNVDPELVAKILANPEMAALLTSLAKSIL